MFLLRPLSLACLLVAWSAAWGGKEPAAPGYACGQDMEREVWQLWDRTARQQVEASLIGQRFTRQGDTYSLYDIQTYLHNLVSMAGRCGRTGRLVETARLLKPVFAQLRPLPRGTGEGWVCRGGPICNDRNRSLGSEVQLPSVQFLGLATSIAARLADASDPEALAYRRLVAQTALSHLQRWSSASAMDQLRAKAAASTDAASSNPALAFEDKQLWMIAIYANVAYLASKDAAVAGSVKRASPDPARWSGHLRVLLDLLRARITVEPARDGGMPSADIDRGFWTANADNRYAGYARPEKPVECPLAQRGRGEPVVKVSADQPVPPDGAGWDLSHARRLVHAFDAIDLGRSALPAVFGVDASLLPRADLRKLFAAQLVQKVWNQDANLPLFKNYWGGANGWYRVAYDNGSGRCSEGTPPFGQSIAFATGGFAAWGSIVPQAGELGRRIRALSVAQEPASRQFVTQNYPDLVEPESTLRGAMGRLMFWPSLVHLPSGDVPARR